MTMTHFERSEQAMTEAVQQGRGDTVRLAPREKYSDYAATTLARPNKEYFDRLHELVEKWDLFRHVNTPSAGVDEYIAKRRKQREIQMIGEVCEKATKNPEYAIPDAFQWYPCLGFIMKGQGVNADFLIKRETAHVLVYAIENTHKHPLDEKKFENAPVERIEKEIAERTVVIDAHDWDGAVGFGRLHLEPGQAIALPLCADPFLPRQSVPDSRGRPSTRLVKYDPDNPAHNPKLKNAGTFGVKLANYIEPEQGDEDEQE